LDIASAIMYGRHLEYRISQSLRNLTQEKILKSQCR
jgi:hypothetical protein